MARLPWLIGAVLISAAACAEESWYRGVIDGRINVLITLKGMDEQSSGTIVYDATGGEGLRLAGSTDARGTFEWREILESSVGAAPRAQHMGTFRGILGADRMTGDGTWASADGKRTFPFSLYRVGQSRSIRTEDVDASVTYPQFEGTHFAALNQHLAAAAKDRLDEHARSVRQTRDDAKTNLDAGRLAQLTRSTDCGVESASHDLASLLCSVYDYSGVRSTTDFHAETFALRDDGSFQAVRLWDILRKSPAHAKRLSDLILNELRRKDASLVSSGGITDFSRELASDTMPFTVIPAGLAFHFVPYAVGSYAEGDLRVVIPNRALGTLWRSDGPLAQRATVK